MVRRLHLKPEFTVLELGPGPGFFSPAVARALPRGKLVLVDVQSEMLDMARKRIQNRGISNVDYRTGDAIALHSDDESFEFVFLVAVLGEVPGRGGCLREIYRVLRQGGLLSLTQFRLGDPDFISMPQMLASFQTAGFRYSARHSGCFHYTLSFRKPE
jgi:ubiquinone/menaquinone biosynthesis C-methylase UbiE